MSRSVIFRLVALFCISFASTPANSMQLDKVRRLKMYGRTSSIIFNQNDMNLFVTADTDANTIKYTVKDSRLDLSNDFSISQSGAVVFEDEITIKCTDEEIVLTLAGSPFTFYQNLFPITFGNATFTSPAAQASVGGTTWRNISTVKGIQARSGEWIVVGLDGGTLRLIFPVSYVESSAVSNLRASLSLKSDMGMVIYIDFGQSACINEFQKFISQRIRR